MAESQAVEVRQLALFGKVMEGLAQGRTVTESCKLAGIVPRTFQKWLKTGKFSELITAAKRDIATTTLAQISEVWPKALKQLCSDVADANLSARDRDQRFRSLLLAMKQVLPDLPDAAEETGESGADWLARQRRLGRFQGKVGVDKALYNQQFNIEQVNITQQGQQAQEIIEIVEGEVVTDDDE